jgi:hypothetical protein
MIRTLFLLIVFAIANISYAFPIKNLKINDKIDLSEFESLDKPIEKAAGIKDKKMVLVWDSNKQISIDILTKFLKICDEKDIVCFAVEVSGKNANEIAGIKFENTKNIYFVKFKGDILVDWGLFTLPVTIFLNEENMIIDALGYQGQYVAKVGRYIDYLRGKITKEEYEQFQSNNKVVTKRSELPKINFVKRLIEDGQKDDAERRLAEIEVDGLNQLEKLKLSEVYIMLGKYDDANKMLNTIAFNMNAKFYIAYAQYLSGKYNESLDILKNIENIFPSKGKLYYLLAKNYAKLGNYEKASEYYEKACEKNIFD